MYCNFIIQLESSRGRHTLYNNMEQRFPFCACTFQNIICRQLTTSAKTLCVLVVLFLHLHWGHLVYFSFSDASIFNSLVFCGPVTLLLWKMQTGNIEVSQHEGESWLMERIVAAGHCVNKSAKITVHIWKDFLINSLKHTLDEIGIARTCCLCGDGEDPYFTVGFTGILKAEVEDNEISWSWIDRGVQAVWKCGSLNRGIAHRPWYEITGNSVSVISCYCSCVVVYPTSTCLHNVQYPLISPDTLCSCAFRCVQRLLWICLLSLSLSLLLWFGHVIRRDTSAPAVHSTGLSGYERITDRRMDQVRQSCNCYTHGRMGRGFIFSICNREILIIPKVNTF